MGGDAEGAIVDCGHRTRTGYIAALADFYLPGTQDYPVRIAAYSLAMGRLYTHNPNDVDAGAFYALSLLAAEAPDDTSLAEKHRAMAVLTPLFVKYPDNPGVVHYIIHACDNPTMAADGLSAANHYGEIAQSGPHAFHMHGHIYMQLGLWPQDIASQLGSITASQGAVARGESGIMDEPHSYDFVLYAYLQSGQDALAKSALDQRRTFEDARVHARYWLRLHARNDPLLSNEASRLLCDRDARLEVSGRTGTCGRLAT